MNPVLVIQGNEWYKDPWRSLRANIEWKVMEYTEKGSFNCQDSIEIAVEVKDFNSYSEKPSLVVESADERKYPRVRHCSRLHTGYNWPERHIRWSLCHIYGFTCTLIKLEDMAVSSARIRVGFKQTLKFVVCINVALINYQKPFYSKHLEKLVT